MFLTLRQIVTPMSNYTIFLSRSLVRYISDNNLWNFQNKNHEFFLHTPKVHHLRNRPLNSIFLTSGKILRMKIVALTIRTK